jgi:hypothetical protein
VQPARLHAYKTNCLVSKKAVEMPWCWYKMR